MRQIILDTETTGLHPEEGHRLVEVACLEMVDRKLTNKYYHQYVNPKRDMPQDAFQIHGISAEFLADKPTFADVYQELLAFIEGAELIIHNAPFDLKFLNYEFNLIDRKFSTIEKKCGVIDTLQLARKKHPGQLNSLDALCRRYHIDNSRRDLHGALVDTELLAHVYLRMTGGQTQLFADATSDIVTPTTVNVTQAPVVSNYVLPVIAPSESELSAHQDFVSTFESDKS